jgi:hypothetical protein
VPTAPYTLEQAASDISALRGIVDTMNEAHTILDGGVVPNTPDTSGGSLYSSSGQVKYVSTDGNAYNTGRLTVYGPSTNLSITSATAVNISGMSFSVGAGVYRVRAKLGGIQGGLNIAQNFLISCPAMSFTALVINFFLESSGDSNGLAWSNSATSPLTFASPAFAAGALFWLDLDAIISFSAAGTCNFQAAEGTSTHGWTVQANCFADIEPVS